MTGETSSQRHGLPHAYAEHGSAFPGSMTSHGATAQGTRVVPEAIFVQPEILGQDNVGTPAVKRNSRPSRNRKIK